MTNEININKDQDSLFPTKDVKNILPIPLSDYQKKPKHSSKNKKNNKNLPDLQQILTAIPFDLLANDNHKPLKKAIRGVLPETKPRTREKLAKFYFHLAKGWTHKKAFETAGIQWSEIYLYHSKSPILREFYGSVKAIQEAILKYSRENALQTRGVDGYEEPVFYKGMQVATVRKFSDKCLELALRASDPDKYGEKVKGNVDLDVTISFTSVGVDHRPNKKTINVTAEEG